MKFQIYLTGYHLTLTQERLLEYLVSQMLGNLISQLLVLIKVISPLYPTTTP